MPKRKMMKKKGPKKKNPSISKKREVPLPRIDPNRAVTLLIKKLNSPDEFLDISEDLVPKVKTIVSGVDYELTDILSSSGLLDPTKEAKVLGIPLTDYLKMKERGYIYQDEEDDGYDEDDEDEDEDDDEDEDEYDDDEDEDDEDDEVGRENETNAIFEISNDVKKELEQEASRMAVILRKKYMGVLRTELSKILTKQPKKESPLPPEKRIGKKVPKKRTAFIMPGKP